VDHRPFRRRERVEEMTLARIEFRRQAFMGGTSLGVSEISN
jgi:hypothetical protein